MTTGSAPTSLRPSEAPAATGPVEANLPAEVRQERVRTLIDGQGFVRVRELSERFGVSTVTVRNDLAAMEERGVVRRVHGGAMPLRPAGIERTFEEVAQDLALEKAAIARAAAQLVNDGEAITLDVGTTTTAFARALVARTELRDVTVFTNGLNIALELEAAAPRIAVVVTGGTLRPKQHSLVNPMATALFHSLHVSTAFLGCNGIDLDSGATNVNLPEAEVKAAMVAAARRRVLLADSSKVGAVALAPFCPIDTVDVLVTDGGADPQIVGEMRARGIDVVIATESRSTIAADSPP